MSENKWANDTLLGVSFDPETYGDLVWESEKDNYSNIWIPKPETEPRPHSCMDHKPPHGKKAFTCPCGKRWVLADVWPGAYWEPAGPSIKFQIRGAGRGKA